MVVLRSLASALPAVVPAALFYVVEKTSEREHRAYGRIAIDDNGDVRFKGRRLTSFHDIAALRNKTMSMPRKT